MEIKTLKNSRISNDKMKVRLKAEVGTCNPCGKEDRKLCKSGMGVKEKCSTDSLS